MKPCCRRCLAVKVTLNSRLIIGIVCCDDAGLVANFSLRGPMKEEVALPMCCIAYGYG